MHILTTAPLQHLLSIYASRFTVLNEIIVSRVLHLNDNKKRL